MQQNLAVFNRACYQLLRASENLTDLSFIQRGRLPLSLEKTDLVDFLEELSQHADDLCWQAGRTLEVDLPQAPIFVWIDRRQMRRALLALLSNAVKFSAPGGTLHLTLTRHGRAADAAGRRADRPDAAQIAAYLGRPQRRLCPGACGAFRRSPAAGI